MDRVRSSSVSISCVSPWKTRSTPMPNTTLPKMPKTRLNQLSSGGAPANRNRGALPSHLPRYEVVIDIDHKECPCCGGALHVIDEERTEQLDIVPAQLRVKVICRPRYGCRTCEGSVVQAPERPIDGGMATEALLAYVVVSKFCDSLPLHRQAQMFQRQGINLDRSTLGSWVGRACWWLTPLYDRLVSTVLSSDKVFADETILPVLAPWRVSRASCRLTPTLATRASSPSGRMGR